ncbi:MAG: hypothetical protein Kow0029_07630 [Candidatus Rifleibacteriota bacterium]
MAKAQKKKKSWQVEEDSLPPIQKGIIVALVSFIPFFFFVLLPVLARDHFVKKLKIPAEVFLSPPEMINLVKTGEVGETFKVTIEGVEFKIPVAFTPVRIDENFIEFASGSRRLSQTISIACLKEAPKLNFTATGFARWFMPTNVLQFMQVILRATWHPVYLMFKAQFFASEGIASKVFEARWDAHHRGFIFPTPGQRGYIGRVFRTNGPGYFEFAWKDEVNPVTLQQWVNLAMKIKPPSSYNAPDPYSPGFYNIGLLQTQAEDPDRQVEVLSRSLNEFFRTGKAMWLIPVALVMKNRGYTSQVIELHKKYLNAFPIGSPLKETWNKILDKTVDGTLKIEIDRKLRKKELDIYCKNLTDKQIGQILVKFTIKYLNGTEKTFYSKLLKDERLFEFQEKHLYVEAPIDVSLIDADEISYRIMQIDFID